jgi:hypothetical protein
MSHDETSPVYLNTNDDGLNRTEIGPPIDKFEKNVHAELLMRIKIGAREIHADGDELIKWEINALLRELTDRKQARECHGSGNALITKLLTQVAAAPVDWRHSCSRWSTCVLVSSSVA